MDANKIQVYKDWGFVAFILSVAILISLGGCSRKVTQTQTSVSENTLTTAAITEKDSSATTRQWDASAKTESTFATETYTDLDISSVVTESFDSLGNLRERRTETSVNRKSDTKSKGESKAEANETEEETTNEAQETATEINKESAIKANNVTETFDPRRCLILMYVVGFLLLASIAWYIYSRFRKS